MTLVNPLYHVFVNFLRFFNALPLPIKEMTYLCIALFVMCSVVHIIFR